MIQQSDEESMIRSYLLGDLDELRREEVEERILCDSGFADIVDAAQDHLIDDYIFDGLSEEERESFEKNFVVNDERQNKIRIAQALEIYVAKDREQRHAVTGFRLVSEWWRSTARFVERHKVWATLSLTAALLLVLLTPKITKWLLPNKPTSPLDGQRVSIERQIAELNRYPSLV